MDARPTNDLIAGNKTAAYVGLLEMKTEDYADRLELSVAGGKRTVTVFSDIKYNVFT